MLILDYPITNGGLTMEMGKKIYNLRIEKGMTLEEVGEKCGVGKSTVRKWENGMIANMKRDKIAKLADALGCSPAYLMGWDENLNEESEDIIVDIMSDNRLLAYVKKINALSEAKKEKLYGYIDLGKVVTQLGALAVRTSNLSDFDGAIPDWGLRIIYGLISNSAYISFDVTWIRLQFKVSTAGVACRMVYGNSGPSGWTPV